MKNMETNNELSSPVSDMVNSKIMSQDKKKEKAKAVVSHLMDRCEADPLYMTKLILSALGKNIFNMVFRIAIYISLIYLLSTYAGLERSVASLLVLASILGYYTIRSTLNNLKNNIAGDSNGHKGNTG